MATLSTKSHIRPFHTINTPRLLIRSSIVSDATAIQKIRTDPLNSPFGGVVNPDLTVNEQAERIAADTITTAEGKNAWMVAIIKDPSPDDESMEIFRVAEGVLMGNTGFNCFPLSPSISDPSKEVITADTGVLIHHRFARRGYAIETMSAVIEYGFVELGCGMISLETSFDNEPIRAMMQVMGIAEKEVRMNGEEKEVAYLIDQNMWESAKQHMKSNGKWYL